MFYKKVVLRNFTKLTGKLLCQSVFFNKVAGLRPATLFKKILWHRCFPVNFVKFLKTPFFKEHLGWPILGFPAHRRGQSEIIEKKCIMMASGTVCLLELFNL